MTESWMASPRHNASRLVSGHFVDVVSTPKDGDDVDADNCSATQMSTLIDGILQLIL